METPFANPAYFPFADVEFMTLPEDNDSVRTQPSLPKNRFGMEELRQALDAVVDDFTTAHITYIRFRREVKNAWERKHPPSEKAHTTCYHAFIKQHMSAVRDAHPNVSHADHMRIIGNMWQEQKPKHKRITGLKRDAAEIDVE